MNIINFCINKYNNNSINNNNILYNCNNNFGYNSSTKNDQSKKSSITINLRPEQEEDLEFNFTNICSNSFSNINNDQNEKSDLNCICNSGKKYELVCANCNQLICTSCCSSGHSNHKLLKVELNSIVFQKVLRESQNQILLENAKSNYNKVEKLIIDNHNNHNYSFKNKIKSNNSNKNKNHHNYKKIKHKNNKICNNNSSININNQLDQYLEFIDLAIKSVEVEEQTISIKI